MVPAPSLFPTQPTLLHGPLKTISLALKTASDIAARTVPPPPTKKYQLPRAVVDRVHCGPTIKSTNDPDVSPFLVVLLLTTSLAVTQSSFFGRGISYGVVK